mmetsp:Transcript_6138/g.15224  ORF Transcript_6138/g.15224 Transcript_6138/m.15224 type:complete len:200 (+) Transcript_6138:1639-2238(+)
MISLFLEDMGEKNRWRVGVRNVRIVRAARYSIARLPTRFRPTRLCRGHVEPVDVRAVPQPALVVAIARLERHRLAGGLNLPVIKIVTRAVVFDLPFGRLNRRLPGTLASTVVYAEHALPVLRVKGARGASNNQRRRSVGGCPHVVVVRVVRWSSVWCRFLVEVCTRWKCAFQKLVLLAFGIVVLLWILRVMRDSHLVPD